MAAAGEAEYLFDKKISQKLVFFQIADALVFMFPRFRVFKFLEYDYFPALSVCPADACAERYRENIVAARAVFAAKEAPCVIIKLDRYIGLQKAFESESAEIFNIRTANDSPLIHNACYADADSRKVFRCKKRSHDPEECFFVLRRLECPTAQDGAAVPEYCSNFRPADIDAQYAHTFIIEIFWDNIHMFWWGAATSAHQAEGGNQNDWSDFEAARNYARSGQAADHYHRFREDFDIARSLGHNAHRFSIEWSRIEPEEGKWNEKEINHYREVINTLSERGLEPFVTLWHWTAPRWFRDRGGWTWGGAPRAFARFAERMAREFSSVNYWITLNEPNVYTGHGYWTGIWPPGERRALLHWFAANRMLARGHKEAYRAIKDARPTALVGFTQHVIWFSRRRAFLKRYLWNHRFTRAVGSAQDFIGINYYLSDRDCPSKSDMGWSIDPEGLYHILCEFRRYRKPLFVFENGIADADDAKRGAFISDHIAALKRAKDCGADVHGYFYWSLIDNFEWDKGFGPRFGLVSVDYDTFARKVQPSAWEYKRIIESSW